MNEIKNYICYVLAVSLLGCVSMPPGFKRIDPITSGDSQGPADIYEDAARIKSFDIFPAAITKSISDINQQGQLSRDSLQQVKGLFCDGSKAKVGSTFNVKVIPPKAAKGIPLDQAVESKTNFLKYAEYFLKTRFFASAIDEKNEAIAPEIEKINPDYPYGTYALRRHYCRN